MREEGARGGGSAPALSGGAVGEAVGRRQRAAGDACPSQVEVEVWPWRLRGLSGECGTSAPRCLLPRFPRGGGGCSLDCPPEAGGRPAGRPLSAEPESANPAQDTLEPSTALSAPSKTIPKPPGRDIHIIILPVPHCRLSGAATPSVDRPSGVLRVPRWTSLLSFSSPGPPALGNASRASEGGESALPLKNTKTSTRSKGPFSGPRNTHSS